MRVVFVDAAAHMLCADRECALAHWGQGWHAVALCLSLLVDSADLAELARWAAIEMTLVAGLIELAHGPAVVTLTPLTDDGSPLASLEETDMEDLQRIHSAQIVDVASNGKRASAGRPT